MMKSSSVAGLIFLAAAIFMAFMLFSSAYTVSAAGNFSCTVTTSGACSYNKVLYVQNDTGGYRNAHAQNVSVGSQADWYYASWSYRKNITINSSQVNGTHTNFPLLVRLASDSDLAADAQDDGDDILFTNSTGTKLDHEIELFNGTTGELVAWVRMPTLVNTSDTTLYMYYGNSSVGSQQNKYGVWDANYKDVWHLPNGTTLNVNDSTSIGNNGSIAGTVTATAGKVDGAASVATGGNTITSASTVGISGTASRTLSAWVKFNSIASGFNLGIGWGANANTQRWVLGLEDQTCGSYQHYWAVWLFGTPCSGDLDSSTVAATDTWYYVSATYDGTTALIYVNGAQGGSKTITLNTADTANVIGYLNADWDAVVDEVRVSNSIRSANWIQTEYNNQKSGSTFLSTGTEESSNSYPYAICCESNSSVAFACGEGVLLRLNDTTNTHVQRGDYAGAIVYGVNSCMSVSPGYFNCTYDDDACPADSECFASMASAFDTENNDTNAHVGPCDEYMRKICCKIIPKLSVSYVSPTPSNGVRRVANTATVNVTVESDPAVSVDTCTLEWNSANETMTMRGSGSSVTCDATKVTTDGTDYTFNVWVNDTVGNIANETIRTFRENDEPAKVMLTSPADQSHTTNRKPTFNWEVPADADSDTLNYTLNITCFGGCSDDNRMVQDIATNSYTPTLELQYFGDDNYYYNWSVRAGDGYEYGEWSDVWKLIIDTNVSIEMVSDVTDFGENRVIGYTDDTTDNSPTPFAVRNSGNCMLNVNISSSDLLWDSVATPSSYFRYKVDWYTGQGGAFNWSGSQTAWANVPETNTTFIDFMNYTSGNNTAGIDISIQVPPSEPPGAKASNILFTGQYHGP
ncbi:MAG: DUF2341 domain-containing protein [Candidatus Aenigmarchaeota archaeon]|nr:DUF2341 domain-containing protein [Candidatus Aenigmarchaeota archaeon]